MQPFLEFCYCGSYLRMLGKLLKQVCSTVGPSLAASLGTLAHYQNVGSQNLFCSSDFGRCSTEIADLVQSLYPCKRSIYYSTRMYGFCVPLFLGV